jgi:hypothetical protein
MSHYPEPKRGENEKDYEYWERHRKWRDREDSLNDLVDNGYKPLSASPWFQKLSLFIAHVIFFAMLCVLIFSESHRSDFLKTIADPNPLWTIAKGVGSVLLLYIMCLLVSPLIVWLIIGGIMIGVLMLFLGIL